MVLALVSGSGFGTARAITIERVGPAESAAPFSFVPLAPAPGAEIPPWFVYRDGSWRYFVTTDHTYECVAPESLLSAGVSCVGGRTKLVTEAEADLFSRPALIPSGTAYKRDYEGVFTAQLIGRTLVAIDHGENKNEIRSEVINGRVRQIRYRNTILSHDTSCWSMFVGNVYRDCNPDYSAFIDASYARDTASNPFGLTGWRDRGPIIWPRDGYAYADGSKASWGVRHPSSIVQGRYLYVFYLDTGSARRNPTGLPTQGADAGIVIARSPARDLSRPGTFEVWAGRRGWVPALPRGLTPADERRYFDRPGGAAVPLLGRNRGSYYFTVARIEHSSRWKYLGLEHYSIAHSPSCPDRGTTLGDALWESNDLIHWHHPTLIPQLTSCGPDQPTAYANSPLRFPHFLDSTGKHQNEVDPARFYLVGTSETGITLVQIALAP